MALSHVTTNRLGSKRDVSFAAAAAAVLRLVDAV